MSSLDIDNSAYAEICKKSFDVTQNVCYTEPKKFPKLEEAKRPNTSKSCFIVVALAAVVVLGLAVACTVFALEIVKLRSEIASLQEQVLHNISDGLENSTLHANRDYSSMIQQLANSSNISFQQYWGKIFLPWKPFCATH